VVTKFNDTRDGSCNADCSLREAVIAANAAPGANTIILAAGTYTLSLGGSDNTSAAGDLDITGPLTLASTTLSAGSGSGATSAIISAGTGWTERILDVISTTATIQNLTIQNGNRTDNNNGAGIKSTNSTLTLNKVILKNNKASAAGAIYLNGGSLVMTDSLLTGNSANLSGGGIYNYNGTASLVNVTLSGNTARGSGGGLYHNGGTLNLVNVTLSNNTADSDANNTGDGGGLYREAGALTAKNSLLAGNLDGSAGTVIPDCYGAVQSQGHNLVGINHCTGAPGAGDLIGDSSHPINPLLGSLADNGGDTLTHALLAGSPALDAGDNAGCPVTDQRGYLRDANCDIGAYEFGAMAFLLQEDAAFASLDFPVSLAGIAQYWLE
jgi:CSLREA domain-containing protein